MTDKPDIKRADLEIVLTILEGRAKQARTAALGVKSRTHAFHRLAGQEYAWTEAANLIRETLRGVSWTAIEEQKRINRERAEGWGKKPA